MRERGKVLVSATSCRRIKDLGEALRAERTNNVSTLPFSSIFYGIITRLWVWGRYIRQHPDLDSGLQSAERRMAKYFCCHKSPSL